MCVEVAERYVQEAFVGVHVAHRQIAHLIHARTVPLGSAPRVRSDEWSSGVTSGNVRNQKRPTHAGKHALPAALGNAAIVDSMENALV